jgi:pimeloyl-ACP methyl ester carboxylesterase
MTAPRGTLSINNTLRQAAMLITLLAPLALTGCMHFQRGDVRLGLRRSALPETAWPQRSTDEVERIRSATPRRLPLYEVSDELQELELSTATEVLLSRPEYLIGYSELLGSGLLRVFDDVTERNPFDDLIDSMRGFRADARYLTSFDLENPRARSSRTLNIESRKRSAGPVPQVRRSTAEYEIDLNVGTAIGLPDVSIGTNMPRARGLIIHVPALMGNKYENKILDQLRDKGWRIAHVDSRVSMPGGELKFTIKDEAAIDATAATIAMIFDNILAEHAYAAEALLEYMETNRPDVPRDPVVLMGFSAGALATPTIAARLLDRVDAVVLVGGAANLLEVSQRSTLTSGGLQINWAEGLDTKENRKRLFEAYLKHSELDPYHTAPLLEDIPVLQIHAMFDSIVPARNGELLHDRLDKPDCMTFLGGHGPLFFFLPQYSTSISKWIDQAAPIRGPN